MAIVTFQRLAKTDTFLTESGHCRAERMKETIIAMDRAICMARVANAYTHMRTGQGIYSGAVIWVSRTRIREVYRCVLLVICHNEIVLWTFGSIFCDARELSSLVLRTGLKHNVFSLVHIHCLKSKWMLSFI